MSKNTHVSLESIIASAEATAENKANTPDFPKDGSLAIVGNSVTAQVAATRKCFALGGLSRTPVYFTVEMWDQLFPVMEQVQAYVEANRHNMLSASERAAENLRKKQEEKQARAKAERQDSAVESAKIATVIAALKQQGLI